MNYGGNYADFARALLNIDQILETAILIEQHSEKYKGTKRENRNLKNVFVLLGLFNDGKNYIPTQFEIKEYKDSNTKSKLYMTVAMTKIEAGVLERTVSNSRALSLIPTSTIHSIADVFSNINTLDKNFLKYIPNGFLNAEQINAKNSAIAEEKARIESYRTKNNGESKYLSLAEKYRDGTASAEETADLQRMVDEAARVWANGDEIYNPDEVNEETGEVGQVFYRSRDGGRTVWNRSDRGGNRQVFLTSSKEVADAFDINGTNRNPGHLAVFAKAANPFTLDANGEVYAGVPIGDNAPQWLRDIAYSDVVYDEASGEYVDSPLQADIDNISVGAFKNGYDALIVNNVKEGVGGDAFTDVVVKDGTTQIKSADPVTYDDEGNIIPLSERFRTGRTGEDEWKNDDIRYSVEDDAAELDEAYKRAVQRDATEDEPTEKGRSFLPQRDAALGTDYAAVATEEI
jgi:hypothetical protein